MQIESITDQGRLRTNNEDRLFTRVFEDGSALLTIADGMGGHAAGEVAAQQAVDTFSVFCADKKENIKESLLRSMQQAQDSILELSRSDPSLRGMGTTLTAMFLSGATVFWAHVGDTRLYHFHQAQLIQITDDHTIPGKLFKEGRISKEQARLHPYGNVLTRCVGCDGHKPDTGLFLVSTGDLLLLSSDGLHDLIPDEQIAEILCSSDPLKAKLEKMVSKCLQAGGKDNITAILARI
ncbi:MAG: protein phosphatase 2C domain-containing protein [Syntrophobacteraceae bacterium]